MGSIWTTRSRVLLVVASLLLALNLGRQVYRWFAFADERDGLRRLGVELDGAGLAVIRTQLLADSLRTAIHRLDAELESERGSITRYRNRAENGSLPSALYDVYRSDLGAYNGKVEERNVGYDRWRDVVARNHRAVRSYNVMADSIRQLGRRMGEPYISVPSPAEVAVQHGLDTTSVFISARPPAQ